MSAKRKHRSIREYLGYLKGEVSAKERYSFEKDLQADPFQMEAMEGMEKIPVGELEEDLLSLHDTLRKRLNRRRRRTFYRIAASIASLLIVGTVFFNIYNTNPKTAEESILKDETFLQEDVIRQAEEAVVDEATSLDEGAKTQAEAPAPAETRARKTDAVPEVVLDMEEKVVHDEQALQAAEGLREAVAMEEVERIQEEVEAEAPVQENRAPVQAIRAPVQKVAEPMDQEADQLVVMEAEPKGAQKKGRALEAPTLLSAQRVSGIVVSSEDMTPLPGASIMVKGSDSGMVADMEGRFSLQADQQAQTTVIASYVGMESEEFHLEGGAENQVILKPDMATLDEVVVIGYESDKSVFPSGAVQTVKLKQEESSYRGAEPEGGLQAYKRYIEEHIRFPSGVSTGNREIVVLKFKVEADGSISQVLPLRSPGDPFTEEAIRLLNEGPTWKPAMNDSGPMEEVVRMRIVFKK